MERGDVARLLSVADADVESFEETTYGLLVTVRDGGRRVVTKDGLFACDGHPANAQLRRWPGHLVGEAGPELVLPPVGEPVSSVETSEPLPEAVPEGSAEVVLSWVDGDPERALAAWEAEQARDKPRTTLLAALEKLVSS
jgi:hypothetical protein